MIQKMEITRMFGLLTILTVILILFLTIGPFQFGNKETSMTCNCNCLKHYSTEGTTEEDFIRKRLNEAEKIWKNGVKLRHTGRKGLTTRWDFFYPAYNCPHLIERLGQVGDGGKWVCGISHLAKRGDKKCIVYGYGISGDSSFEEDILSRTNCTLRGFDHTVKSASALEKYPSRSSFDQIGIGATDGGSLRTLKSEMKKHVDEFVDILKMDVEGAEFGVFTQILKDFPEQLPFGQLLVELHVAGMKYEVLKEWFEALENAGLRAFSNEPNLHAVGENKVNYYEYSFLNVKTDHVLLHG